MKFFVRLLFFVSVDASIRAASFEDRFAIVLIDAETEAKIGAFPLDRIHDLKALERAAEMRPTRVRSRPTATSASA